MKNLDNLGDGIDYSQLKRECLGDLIGETLKVRCGRQDADSHTIAFEVLDRTQMTSPHKPVFIQAFELNGGEDAFINIKYLVPVYQSVVIS